MIKKWGENMHKQYLH